MKTSTPSPSDPDLLQRVGQLLQNQNLAVLSTQGDGQPYTNLVAFAALGDLRGLLFATTRATRKYRNLCAEPRVSLLIDNRSNRAVDFQTAMAATALGRAAEAEVADLTRLRRVYLAKHPYLEDFLVAPDCALFQVHVETYTVVQQFQIVRTVRPGEPH